MVAPFFVANSRPTSPAPVAKLFADENTPIHIHSLVVLQIFVFVEALVAVAAAVGEDLATMVLSVW